MAIEALPATEREVVRLVHGEGGSLADAAALSGVWAGTARMRYQRARKRLRSRLSDE